jgi:hypothetical protein
MTIRPVSVPIMEDVRIAAAVRPWALGAMLLLPVYFFYIAHFTIPGAPGTGFVQYDQSYYMALARAYFSHGHFALVYGLPFSPDPATPRIYF